MTSIVTFCIMLGMSELCGCGKAVTQEEEGESRCYGCWSSDTDHAFPQKKTESAWLWLIAALGVIWFASSLIANSLQ